MGRAASGVAVEGCLVVSGDETMRLREIEPATGSRGSEAPSLRFREDEGRCDKLSGVDSASGRKSSSSSRSKVDESMSRFCKILGCRRLGFRVPKMEFSRDGVGWVDRRMLSGGLAVLATVGTLLFESRSFSRGWSSAIEPGRDSTAWFTSASISFVALVMFCRLCALLGYAPGLSPAPTAPEP